MSVKDQVLKVRNSLIGHENIKVVAAVKYFDINKTKEITNKLNITLKIANKYYPSSKLCSGCNNKKEDLKLSDRIYKCNKCGLIIDRDLNAAINLARC